MPILARAAVTVGAYGLLVEVHADPDKALSDGDPALRPDKFEAMMAELRPIARAIGRAI